MNSQLAAMNVVGLPHDLTCDRACAAFSPAAAYPTASKDNGEQHSTHVLRFN